MTELELECIRRIAAEKLIAPESITLDTSLESVGLDSLDRVTLAFDLEEKYGVEIPEAKLHQIQTVGDVAVAVEQALTRKREGNQGRAGAA